MESWFWIPGFGFLISDSSFGVAGFEFTVLDSWVGLLGLDSLIWIIDFGFLFLIPSLDSWIWIPGFHFLDIFIVSIHFLCFLYRFSIFIIFI